MLVRSGYARPGQTGWDLIYSFELDVILDLAYSIICEGLTPEQCKELDDNLAALDVVEEKVPDRMVERTREDGTTVVISEQRLEELRKTRRLTVKVGKHTTREG